MRRLAGRRGADSLEDLDARTRRVAAQKVRAMTRGSQRRLDSLDASVAVIRVELEHIAHHLRALEQRLDDSESPGASVIATGTGAETSEAQNVLDEVRREHARIRARFQVISRYEERIRRLEQAVTKLNKLETPQ
jgi:uncharacterized coiled-coil protein SlyX